MSKLVLFDIDGTLVKSIPNNPHNLAFKKTIKNLYALDIPLRWGEAAGLTDRLIFKLMLERAGWDDSKIAESMPKLINELEAVYINDFPAGSTELLPGVKELLAALEAREAITGLITGNLKEIAKTKLEDAGIYSYFSVGGFGSDMHTRRSELVEIAIARALSEPDNANIYVIGDTPKDIWAAKESGVIHTVGVATSHHNKEALLEAGAEVVLEDLSNTNEVLTILGY